MKARADNATDPDGESVYRLSRAELFKRACVMIEVPGELAQRNWDSIVFPKNASFNDTTKILKRLNEARTMLVRCGKFDDAPATLEREMHEVKKKVPLGSDLRYTFTRAVSSPRISTCLWTWCNTISIHLRGAMVILVCLR